MDAKYLNSQYDRENALQAINKDAVRIEKETGISVIKAHLGNPNAPGCEETDKAMASYYAERAKHPMNQGYADVIGHPNIRRVIANAISKINRLPEGSITNDNIRGVVGGTGALNIAMQIFNNPTVLVNEPYYPPWMEIGEHTHTKIDTFPLRAEDDYLLNPDILREKIRTLNEAKPDKPVVLIYHYPNNPTGKTLDENEARKVAATLNDLCKEFPNLALIQEDLYLATTAADKGIYTPLPYLDNNAKERVTWLHSPSKMGHAQDRGAIIAAYDKELLKKIRGAISFDSLGASHPSLLATAFTLHAIANGGVDARGEPDLENYNNYRYQVADYYQSRMKVLANGFKTMESATRQSILPSGLPGGAYYLYPDFKLLKGKPVPDALKNAVGRTTFENAEDLTKALLNAHLVGLQSMSVAPGTIFTSDKQDMHIRIAAVEPDAEKMKGAVNTLLGITQLATGVKMGAYFHKAEELKSHHPAGLPITTEQIGYTGVLASKHGKGQTGFIIRN